MQDVCAWGNGRVHVWENGRVRGRIEGQGRAACIRAIALLIVLSNYVCVRTKAAVGLCTSCCMPACLRLQRLLSVTAQARSYASNAL